MTAARRPHTELDLFEFTFKLIFAFCAKKNNGLNSNIFFLFKKRVAIFVGYVITTSIYVKHVVITNNITKLFTFEKFQPDVGTLCE